MVEIWLPYGSTEVCVTVPPENFLGTVEPKNKPETSNPDEEIKYALEHPINSPRLGELVKPGMKVAIVVENKSTHTKLMVSQLLGELNGAGIDDSTITILLGSVTEPITSEEAKRILGEDIYNRISTVVHNHNSSDLVEVGVTQYKTHVMLNRIFVEADVKILTGYIRSHPYVGYEGDGQTVLSVGGAKTLRHNHGLIADLKSSNVDLENNSVYLDMKETVSFVKIDFALNAVTDEMNDVVKAFAGNMKSVFSEGIKLYDSIYKISVTRFADIVIVSPGAPQYDCDLYHAVESIEHAVDIVKDSGMIILVAECSRGHGNSNFINWMTRFKSFGDIRSEIKKNFVVGSHAAFLLLRALEKKRITLVSSMPEFMVSGVFKIRAAKSVNEALQTAFRSVGRNGKVWIIPKGQVTLPILEQAPL
ncbi:MAG: nickel-dependent lactate racemase [Candidatus Bathyarchaeota archaeon]